MSEKRVVEKRRRKVIKMKKIEVERSMFGSLRSVCIFIYRWIFKLLFMPINFTKKLKTRSMNPDYMLNVSSLFIVIFVFLV